MSDSTQSAQQRFARVVADLTELRTASGPPTEFWPRYVASVCQLADADRAVLMARGADPAQGWKRMLEWPRQGDPSRMVAVFLGQLEGLADRCLREGSLVAPLEPKAERAAGNHVLVTPIKIGRANESCVLACLLSEVGEPAAREALVRLQLAAETPELYQANLALREARGDVEKMASALDAAVLINAEERFLAAALAFCNNVATRFQCERVSLGWLERGFVHLRAMSRTESFDRKMAAAQALEAAMEETLDQDDEVIWPAPEGASVVTRDHEAYARDQKLAHVSSAPLRIKEEGVGVVLCERQGAPFTPLEVQQLRLCCDLVAGRLAELRGRDRWFGARWAAAAKKQAGRLVGVEHTWAKILALVIVVALGFLFFFKATYRVEGKFTLRSDEVTYLTAPFDGYIDQTQARPGDEVAAGQTLISLKTTELELEESSAVADLNRYEREAEKARATRSLAEMRIAQALAEQAKARLDLVRHRLDQAVIKAPFAGVVIEGDLRERLGAPVKQADVLMKVARIDTLYVEAEVNERDVHEVLRRTDGELAFVSQPRMKFPLRITRIEQAAVPKDQANVFLVRCAVEGGVQPWWRPGMSGVVKLNVEKRTLFWIFTHRTVDFLRLLFWW